MEREQLEKWAKKAAEYLVGAILYIDSIKYKNIDEIVEDYYKRIDAIKIEDMKEAKLSKAELAEFKKYTKKEIANLLREEKEKYREIQKAYV